MKPFLRFRKLFTRTPAQQPQFAPTAQGYKKPLPSLEQALAVAISKGQKPSQEQALEPHLNIKMRLDELREKGFLPPGDEDHKISNEFRALKRAIMARLAGRSAIEIALPNVIMVASALPGEGKTTCALNLALAIALEQDYSVVLIDGDVVNPSISRTLGVEKEPGLLDALRKPGLTLEELEIGTGVPNLHIISSGQRGIDAPELLSSNRMTQLIQRMAKQPNRVFIFDSTPILLTNESRALSEMVGQVAFVVRAGSTQRAAVKAALGLLPKDPFVGLILNHKANRGADDYYYEYGAYYAPYDEGEDSVPAA